MSARGKKRPISIPALVAWITICALVSVAFLAYGASGSRSARGGLGWQALVNLPLAAVLALVLHVLFRLRLPRWFGWLGFGVLYLSLVGASAWSISRQQMEQRIRQAAQEQAAQQAAAAAAASAAAAAAASDGLRSTELVRAMHARIATQRRDYERELELLGWGRVLNPARLRQDETLERTRTLLASARQLVADYRGRTPQLFADTRRDVANAELSEPAKRRLLAEFDAALERNQAQVLESWALEESVMGEVEAVTQLLHANRPNWTVAQGQLSFRRLADRERFEAMLDKVRMLTDQQARMQTAAARRAQQAQARFGS
jgi:hypothetical protein